MVVIGQGHLMRNAPDHTEPDSGIYPVVLYEWCLPKYKPDLN